MKHFVIFIAVQDEIENQSLTEQYLRCILCTEKKKNRDE